MRLFFNIAANSDVQYMVKLLGFLQQHNIQATQLLIEEE